MALHLNPLLSIGQRLLGATGLPGTPTSLLAGLAGLALMESDATHATQLNKGSFSDWGCLATVSLEKSVTTRERYYILSDSEVACHRLKLLALCTAEWWRFQRLPIAKEGY